MAEQQFDVFLAHSSKDKRLIRQIYRQLKARGIRPWLDEEEIAPGTRFADEIQQAIGQIKSAAVCIGQSGLGRWQVLELEAFIRRCVERDIRVIPVLLPGVDRIPDNLIFLGGFHAVPFSTDINDERALSQLVWGITGQKPTREPNNSHSEAAPVLEPDDLSSEKGIDYTHLRDLLAAGDWKAADQETADRMLDAMGKSSWGNVPSKDLLNFPCADLKTIDRLWVKYSQGQFGFSVQKDIYVECGAKLDGEYPGDAIWGTFCDRIGWRRGGQYISYSDGIFDTSAPQTV
ncbi:GUN4 domain containing transcriptional regulator [Halomicronema hongdechloris C2206]|uniref:GUN4 domain containing transcriptional regulator n=1 Tax=Halomicronema hongdechloris C2206 TaxID=1641165 RepID=A0A1Z3HT54_9CYAN|nr:GUN4 domain-containing protein [Halomicronema hongdechloris]ASC73465.1 GUN4 domain containing transcriptional regulator [Halomicronema hongdechloris C2206]